MTWVDDNCKVTSKGTLAARLRDVSSLPPEPDVAQTAAETALPAVHFIYSDACHVQAALHTLTESPEIERMARREKWIVLGSSVPMAMIVGGAFGWFVAEQTKPDPPWIGVLAGFAIAIPTLFYSGRRKLWREYYKVILEHAGRLPSEPSSNSQVTTTVGPLGITVACDGITTSYEWSKFERVIKTGSFLCVQFADNWHGISVPISAFASAEEATQWQSAVKGMIESRGYGPGARVRAYLDAHDARCGQCGHTLKGLRDPRCPECGVELFARRMRTWLALAVPVRNWWFARQG